jgi:hypothetical protein
MIYKTTISADLVADDLVFRKKNKWQILLGSSLTIFYQDSLLRISARRLMCKLECMSSCRIAELSHAAWNGAVYKIWSHEAQLFLSSEVISVHFASLLPRGKEYWTLQKKRRPIFI